MYEHVLITKGKSNHKEKRYHDPKFDLSLRVAKCGLYDGREDVRGEVRLAWTPKHHAEKEGLTPCKVCYR